MCERIGILGGTFDPIHFGHLLMAEESRVALNLTKIVFIPNGQPAHKTHFTLSSAEDRYYMTVLATKDNPFFCCDRMEIDRPGISYTVDTLKDFHQRGYDKENLYFITGSDAILDLLTWHEWQTIPNLCKLVATTRPGYDLDMITQFQVEHGVSDISFLTIPGIDISSSDIRQRVREGRNIRYLTTESVCEYISYHRLYKND